MYNQNLNHPNATCNGPKIDRNLCISDLATYEHTPAHTLKHVEPDHQFILAFNNYRLDNKVVYDDGYHDHFMSKLFRL